MKVIVAYPTLNFLGGGERVCVLLMKTLKKTRYNVVLVTLDKTNWFALRKVFGETFVPDSEFYLLPRVPALPTLTLRQAFIALSFVLELFFVTLKGRHELIINARGEIADSLGDVVYINAMPLKLMNVYPQIQPTRGAQWRCFSKLYSLVTEVLRGPDNVILVNSKFNQGIVKQHLARESLVVYPPVDTQEIQSLPEKTNRDDLVITISRLRSAKGLGIIPDIATQVQNCKFILIGTTDKDSEQCMREISEKIEKSGLQSRTEIFTNKPFSFILDRLATAKVFLQTQAYEAFGMSVVEAMAAGCVPVVPKDGGPWFDILDEKEGVYGFSYESSSEAAEKIKILLENDELRTEVSIRARRRAMDFDSSVFERRISRIVNDLYFSKQSHCKPS
jgi:glycosyltransferase involved in cell wall biosynthesis